MPAAGLPPADLLPVQREATAAYRAARAILLPIFRAVFRLRVEGRENLPRVGAHGGAYIAIANHLNWLDPFVLLYALPVVPRVHFLGNPEGLVTHRFQWRVVRSVGGYIAVDQARHGDQTLYHYVDLCLRRGGAVGLFPEGHYGDREGAIQDFHSGFAHFAVDNQVPVMPVALSGTQDLWLRKTVRIIIGSPISPEGKDVDTVMAEARAAMSALLPVYEAPAGPRLLRKRLTHLL
ncbi:MAG TPA: 1-acyl-sn-glycerol-3-phosphate acyltransferase [Candidatus Dormibacteraeota bacterium]|jgi:1-acyl-sn-glycerol-3-phosphate acyltransferase|nr:1-acyl-sn-glycerol-3-phosphate acyltransferase [Candidatus Dormibacteraeota bacterium]